VTVVHQLPEEYEYSYTVRWCLFRLDCHLVAAPSCCGIYS